MEADPVRLALTHAYTIREAIDKARELVEGRKCSHDRGSDDERRSEAKGLTGIAAARRARELPGLILSAGLVPALTFYMSKSNEDKYKVARDLLEKGATALDCHTLKTLEGELGGGEGAGYTLILAAVVKALSELAPSILPRPPATLKDLAKALHDMLGEGRDLEAERVLEPYLVELKKVLEALTEKEEGR